MGSLAGGEQILGCGTTVDAAPWMRHRYSDYKRFNVETLNTINKPKEVLENASKP